MLVWPLRSDKTDPPVSPVQGSSVSHSECSSITATWTHGSKNFIHSFYHLYSFMYSSNSHFVARQDTKRGRSLWLEWLKSRSEKLTTGKKFGTWVQFLRQAQCWGIRRLTEQNSWAETKSCAWPQREIQHKVTWCWLPESLASPEVQAWSWELEIGHSCAGR